MSKLLIKNATLLTIAPGWNATTGDILIDDDTISSVGPAARTLSANADEVIDATGMIALPGLVNAHVHLWQAGLRGIAGDWTLGQYFGSMLASLAAHFTPQDLYLGNLFGALAQLDAGVTTAFDYCHNLTTPDHADRAVDALQESGLRTVFGYGTAFDNLGAWYFDSKLPHPADARRMRVARLADDSARVTMALAPRGPDFNDIQVSVADIRMARELGVVASMHTGAGALGSAQRGIARLNEAKMLGPDVSFVHGNMISADAFKAAADAGSAIIVTPEVEMQMGLGFPATGKIVAAGGMPALGTDIASAVGDGLFAQMRIALQMQRALDNAEALSRGEESQTLSLSARDMLTFATLGSARAIGLEKRIGSIEAGKQADIVLLRTDRLGMFPINDPVAAVMLHACSADVDTVVVAGRTLKRNGALVNPPSKQYRHAMIASAHRILETAAQQSKAPAQAH